MCYCSQRELLSVDEVLLWLILKPEVRYRVFNPSGPCRACREFVGSLGLQGPESRVNRKESFLAVAFNIAFLLQRYFSDGHFQSEASPGAGRCAMFLALLKLSTLKEYHW